MNGFRSSVTLTIATALVAAAIVFALPLEPAVRSSAHYGVGLSLIFGLLALLMKSQVSRLRSPTGGAQLKATMLAQGVSFGLRLVAVGLGTAVCHFSHLSPVAFVIGFFSTYLVQQAIEVRHMLASISAGPEVKS